MASSEDVQEGYAQKNFAVEKFLGKGSYGSVYKVKRVSDQKVYAIKESNIKHMSQEERQDAANEIRLLASVKHDNVIAYYEAFLDGNKLCIVMEYCDQGDLAKCIKRRAQQRKYFPEEQIWSYFIQICRGLVALHGGRIIHRDIKSANIMRPDSNIVKIGDLGVAKVMKGAMTKTQIGTPHYMPPEVWRNKPYNFSSDVWALGCVLYEMATFNVPFEARSMSELRYKVIRGQYAPIPSVYSPEMTTIIRDLLNADPATRPSAEQVLNHPIVLSRLHLAPAPISPPSNPTGSSMLATIQVPQNLKMLKARLPKASYPQTGPTPAAKPPPTGLGPARFGAPSPSHLISSGGSRAGEGQGASNLPHLNGRYAASGAPSAAPPARVSSAGAKNAPSPRGAPPPVKPVGVRIPSAGMSRPQAGGGMAGNYGFGAAVVGKSNVVSRPSAASLYAGRPPSAGARAGGRPF